MRLTGEASTYVGNCFINLLVNKPLVKSIDSYHFIIISGDDNFISTN